MTVAMSLLVHGEAVRFNRGQSRGDDYDFKYMRGRDGREFPYVSSQCYKRYWRESLAGPFSPITREKDAGGKEKNQAFTAGNPIIYVDDDLFGYMIAGASETGEESADPLGLPEGEENGGQSFDAENIKDVEALRRRLLDQNALSEFLLEQTAGAREVLKNSAATAPEIRDTLLQVLNKASVNPALAGRERFGGIGGTSQILRRLQKTKDSGEARLLGKALLFKAFSKELQERPKRPTTRRTAPIRMHALVAFSGIKTAKDFQTFSRDIPYTGRNSVVNPAAQGIYSGWLKTRILIESHRMGKFYIGENMDILRDQADGREIKKEPNPYSRDGDFVEFVELETAERVKRLRAALRALADIGNKQGPASGALHDGSLRPKAFVAAMMNCADSPFDYVWVGHNDDGMPYLDVTLLRDSIKDWEDLFSAKKVYVGLPVDSGRESRPTVAAAGGAAAIPARVLMGGIKEIVEEELAKIGFEAIVDTPRKALIRLAEEAVL
jgi:hypothetical protein